MGDFWFRLFGSRRVAPHWLQVFSSWLHARVNFGPRRHTVHSPGRGDCCICLTWQGHDEAFHDDGALNLTERGREVMVARGRCGKPPR